MKDKQNLWGFQQVILSRSKLATVENSQPAILNDLRVLVLREKVIYVTAWRQLSQDPVVELLHNDVCVYVYVHMHACAEREYVMVLCINAFVYKSGMSAQLVNCEATSVQCRGLLKGLWLNTESCDQLLKNLWSETSVCLNCPVPTKPSLRVFS